MEAGLVTHEFDAFFDKDSRGADFRDDPVSQVA